MAEQVTINLRGKEYPVKKLHGVTVIGLIQDLYFQGGVLDPSKIPSTAQALRRAIPDLPDYLISDESIHLQPDEFYAFVDSFRKIYFLDNLEDARKIGDYREEYRYAIAYATFLAYLELREKLRQEDKNSWDWKQTQDVRIGIDDAPDERIWYYFEKYYQEQMELAKVSNTDRFERLKQILAIGKEKFSANKKNTEVKAFSDSGNENAELRRKIAELEKAQQTAIAG
jgi:hypothetical protein